MSQVRVLPAEPNLRKAVGDLSSGLSLCLDRRSFRKEIKWLAQGGGQFPAPPGAVRNQKIEKPPFFARILFREKPLGVLRQFDKAHAVAHPVENLVVESQAAEERAELLPEHLLANVWLVAFPLVAGAMVVRCNAAS